MVNAHRSRQLEYDPTQLSVTELKFVVDHRLPKSELDWARESVKLRRASFDKIFSSIKYDRPRLEGGIFRWPYGDYSLGSIKEKKKGEFVWIRLTLVRMAGKAKGIPTLTLLAKVVGAMHGLDF